MERIKQIIENLDIDGKREQVKQNKREMLNLKTQMSNLTFHLNVAKYANSIDVIKLKYKDFRKAPEDKKQQLLLELEKLRNEQKALETDPYVQEYQRLLYKYNSLDREKHEFYRLINEALRTELLDLDLPEVYIHQGTLNDSTDYQLYRHLIAPGTFVYSDESPDCAIYPAKKVTSNRRSRHYYNKISYKYLDQLSRDHTFDLQPKKLGKIRIVSRGNK